MKLLALIATALFSSAALADTCFQCTGNTVDGATVEVRGCYDENYFGSTKLEIRRWGYAYDMEYRYFGPEDVTASPPTYDTELSVTAVLYPNKRVNIEYGYAPKMKIYLDEAFDHEFFNHSCVTQERRIR